MGQSLKAILQLILLGTAIAALCVWTAVDKPDTAVWAARVICPVVAIVMAGLLFRVSRRKETLPDPLAKVSNGYFERNGMCFTTIFAVNGGFCWASVYVQNRYARLGTVRVLFRPGAKSFALRRLPVPAVDEEISCPGGALVVRRIPYPIEEKMRGQKVWFDVLATTKYPGGRGKLLRYREGLRVEGAIADKTRLGCSAALLLMGVLRRSTPASCTVTLPADVGDVPAGVAAQEEVLWEPDLPTGGFPVMAAMPVKEMDK
jgi:hypothetical protein